MFSLFAFAQKKPYLKRKSGFKNLNFDIDA